VTFIEIIIFDIDSYLKEGAAGMSVIEIGYPSGFTADKDGITKHKLLKRVEDGDKKVILYLDEVFLFVFFFFKACLFYNCFLLHF
jgi:hypothetical protein